MHFISFKTIIADTLYTHCFACTNLILNENKVRKITIRLETNICCKIVVAFINVLPCCRSTCFLCFIGQE